MFKPDFFTVVAALIALQAAAFGWRIQREVPLGDEGRRQWLPLCDWLNVAALLAVVLGCVLWPLSTASFGPVARGTLVAAWVLFALHPINVAAHYRLFSPRGRSVYDDRGVDHPWITDQEMATSAVTLILVTLGGCLGFRQLV